MEFTLEDTLDILKDTHIERQKQIEDWMNILNNNSIALNQARTFENVREKQEKFVRSLFYSVRLGKIKDFPIVRTDDMLLQAVDELEQQIENSEFLVDKKKAKLSAIKEDISYMEIKQQGLEKMKEAYSDTADLKTGTTYNEEYIITKRMFRKVKNDLHDVVELLFPENQEFKHFFADLVSSYTKGGNELYVDVTPEVFDLVNFLIEANIAVYHRNDRSKVRLMDPL